MPAIYNSLRHGQHLTPHVAWRVSFVVPGVLIVVVAVSLVLLCPDTPTGSWDERFAAAEDSVRRHSVTGVVVPGRINDAPTGKGEYSTDWEDDKPHGWKDNEVQVSDQEMLDTARGEVVQKPTIKEMAHVVFSPQTFVTAACYFCTFGAELSINSILGNYYKKQFPALTLQETGNWAAMFGLLNGKLIPWFTT